MTSLQQLDKRFGINALQFKILNLHPDLPSSRVREVGIFKACTGGVLLIPAEIKDGHNTTLEMQPSFGLTQTRFLPSKIKKTTYFWEDGCYSLFLTSFQLITVI